MKIIILPLLINLWLQSYAQNDNSCTDCTFNIVANNIDTNIQSCPVTPHRIHRQSLNQISAVKCIHNAQDGQYIINECDINIGKNTFDDTPFDLTPVRRRQLSSTLMISNYLIQTCIAYDIIGTIPDCMNINGIFLPLCSNANTSELTASHINQLIMNETFDDSSNVKSAEGVNINGNLGILVELKKIDKFEICLGNVIVNEHDLNELYAHRIETSDGIIFGYSRLNHEEVYCNVDGLPCFNFLFRQKCSPDTAITDEIEYEKEAMETSKIGEKMDHNSTDSIDVHMHYDVMIIFSYWAFVYLWSIVLFVIIIILLNMIFQHYWSTSESDSEEQQEGEGEQSDISDIEAV